MNHWKNCALILALFAALYARSAVWGWLPIDDAVFLQRNEHLGHGLSSYWWGLWDLEINRRWTPGFWMLAQLFHGGGAVGYHLGTLAVGAALCGSVYFLLCEVAERWKALVLTLVFLASPMRHEVFSWAIGFSYCAVAAFLCWAFVMYYREHYTAAVLFAVAALLVYPQAAGAAVLLAVLLWKCWQGKFLFVYVVVLAVLQMSLRVKTGLVPFEPTLQVACWVIPHYFGSLFVPVATLPVTQAGFYPLVVIGAGLFALFAAVSVRGALAFALVMAPTVLASITEPFYWGARYSTFGAIAVLVCVAIGWERYRERIHPACLYLLVWALGLSSFVHFGFSSARKLVERANIETQFLYSTAPVWLRPIL